MKQTRKIFTRMLAVLMTVIMIVCALEPCAFAKTQETVKHYDVYTCLGDSHAAGYGTTGYVYSRIPAPNAYHSLVANAVGAKLNDYGVGGFRTHEISYMLDDNYDMDWTVVQPIVLTRLPPRTPKTWGLFTRVSLARTKISI